MRHLNFHFHLGERIRLTQPISLRCVSKVKKWAYENAWTLIVMAIGFAITWSYILFLGVKNSVG